MSACFQIQEKMIRRCHIEWGRVPQILSFGKIFPGVGKKKTHCRFLEECKMFWVRHNNLSFRSTQLSCTPLYQGVQTLLYIKERFWNFWMIQSSFLPDWYTGGPSSSCEMIILRSKSHGEIISVCMGIFTTTFRNKTNTVKFSLNIPHLTSTLHRLLSDRLRCWKEPI